MKIARCRDCGGCGALMIGDAFARGVPDFWIDLYRCEQYVICVRCGGIGIVIEVERNDERDSQGAQPAPIRSRMRESRDRVSRG